MRGFFNLRAIVVLSLVLTNFNTEKAHSVSAEYIGIVKYILKLKNFVHKFILNIFL